MDFSDFAIGAAIGYVAYQMMPNTRTNPTKARAKDIQYGYDSKQFANKVDALLERGIDVRPIAQAAAATSTPDEGGPQMMAIMDEVLAKAQFNNIRNPDLRETETGTANCSGLRLLNRFFTKYPRCWVRPPQRDIDN